MDQLYIRKRSLPEWSALLLVLLPLTYSFLTEFIGLSRNIRFISDLLLIFIFAVVLVSLIKNRYLLISKGTGVLMLVMVALLLHTMLGYAFNFQSVFYYIWGARNNFRFYVALLIFVWFLDQKDSLTCLRVMDIFFWTHFAVTIVQYFYFGFAQDYLGGIFGAQKGCNGYSLIFISIVVMKALLSYMNGEEKAILTFSKCAVAFITAALSELKVFFLVFILILTISAIITRFSIKKYVIILVSVLLLIVSYLILISLFDNFRGFLNFDYLITELLKENYASSEDLGRFTSIPVIRERFLTTVQERLFGVGLGNCDTSSISIFNTDFYNRYSDIHYSIFSVSFVFLETGFIGLTIFTLFFGVCLVQSIKFYRQKIGNLMFNQMGIIMSVLCLILMFYNSSLRTEAGYMVYFVLALPFIGVRNQSASSLR